MYSILPILDIITIKYNPITETASAICVPEQFPSWGTNSRTTGHNFYEDDVQKHLFSCRPRLVLTCGDRGYFVQRRKPPKKWSISSDLGGKRLWNAGGRSSLPIVRADTEVRTERFRLFGVLNVVHLMTGAFGLYYAEKEMLFWGSENWGVWITSYE